MFSLICVWINSWINNREAGDLRRYGAHCDVIVMWRAHDCAKSNSLMYVSTGTPWADPQSENKHSFKAFSCCRFRVCSSNDITQNGRRDPGMKYRDTLSKCLDISHRDLVTALSAIARQIFRNIKFKVSPYHCRIHFSVAQVRTVWVTAFPERLAGTRCRSYVATEHPWYDGSPGRDVRHPRTDSVRGDALPRCCGNDGNCDEAR